MFPTTRVFNVTGACTLITPLPAGAGRYTITLHRASNLLSQLLRLHSICGFLNRFLQREPSGMGIWIIL
jgi:hypothetical protein